MSERYENYKHEKKQMLLSGRYNSVEKGKMICSSPLIALELINELKERIDFLKIDLEREEDFNGLYQSKLKHENQHYRNKLQILRDKRPLNVEEVREIARQALKDVEG